MVRFWWLFYFWAWSIEWDFVWKNLRQLKQYNLFFTLVVFFENLTTGKTSSLSEECDESIFSQHLKFSRNILLTIFVLLHAWCILFNNFDPKWTITIGNATSATIRMFATCRYGRIKGTIDFEIQVKAIISWTLGFKGERIWIRELNGRKKMQQRIILPPILRNPLNTIQAEPSLAAWNTVTSSRLEYCDTEGKVGSDRYFMVTSEEHCLSNVLGPITILYIVACRICQKSFSTCIKMLFYRWVGKFNSLLILVWLNKDICTLCSIVSKINTYTTWVGRGNPVAW